jgi:hypothetical protein
MKDKVASMIKPPVLLCPLNSNLYPQNSNWTPCATPLQSGIGCASTTASISAGEGFYAEIMVVRRKELLNMNMVDIPTDDHVITFNNLIWT